MTVRTQSRPMYEYMVFDTIQAAEADVSVANSAISVGDPLEFMFNFSELLPGVSNLTAAVTGTNQVDTLTASGVALDQEYGIKIQWYDYAKVQTLERSFVYVAQTGDTATTVANAIAAQVNADPIIPVTAAGGATLVLTADSTNFPGQRIFTTTVTQPGGGFALVLTTPGVAEVGTTAALTNEGLDISNFTSGDEYYRVRMVGNRAGTPANTSATSNYRTIDIFLNEGAANFATTRDRFIEILGALNTAGTAVDPELLAVS